MTLFLYILLTLCILIALAALYTHSRLPKLPDNVDEKIKKALTNDLNELKGIQGHAYNGAVKIWYQSVAPKGESKGDVLLIMGISRDAFSWPDYFLETLVEMGYRVVRIDNRGTGMSDWMENWSKKNDYLLEDMALDVKAVLDELNIEKINLIGVSLGGMISQTLSIMHPERVQTMTSIMSSGYVLDPELPAFNRSLFRDLFLAHLRYNLIKSESNLIKGSLVSRDLLRGTTKYPIDIEEIAQSLLYNTRRRRGINIKATDQQSRATVKSGSRYEGLKKLTVPSLIVHGTSDPLIDVEHGKKCYELIPNAKKMWIDGMGHTIPEVFGKEVIVAVDRLIVRNRG